jgi:hypothetical protein
MKFTNHQTSPICMVYFERQLESVLKGVDICFIAFTLKGMRQS